MKMDRVLEMVRRNESRLDRIEAALGLKADRLEETVGVHDEKIKGLEQAMQAHDKNDKRHRPADVPPDPRNP